jgi:hypothetical protein
MVADTSEQKSHRRIDMTGAPGLENLGPAYERRGERVGNARHGYTGELIPGLAVGALAWLCALMYPQWVAAQTVDLDSLIDRIFGDAPAGHFDVNRDGQVSAADVVAVLMAAASGPTETPAAMPSDTPTATATIMPTQTRTVTPLISPTPTATPPPLETPSPTATPTTMGLLFAGSVRDLVPHGVGDTFVYQNTSPTGKVTTETVKITSAQPDGTFVVDDQLPTKRQTQTYLDNGTELFLTEEIIDLMNGQPAVRTTCVPALPRLLTPVMAGQEVSTSSKCDNHIVATGQYAGTFQLLETLTPIEAVDSVSVPAGTYRNVVHIGGTRSLGNEIDDFYLAPGVGVIRRVTQTTAGTTTSELTSATVGSQSVGP